ARRPLRPGRLRRPLRHRPRRPLRGRPVGDASELRPLPRRDRPAGRAGPDDLLVVPGLELTYDDPDPARAAHAVAVGLDSFVDLDEGLDAALAAARSTGAALIAAHPYDPAVVREAKRPTFRWALEWRRLAPMVDRFELFNRGDCFHWVASVGLPAVASGDFHRREHLATWKTLLPAAKDEQAIVEYLRSSRPAYLVNLAKPLKLPAAA